jgi:DedD protein
MAEKDEAPRFNPRHRIVGAVVVVALAVILVPLILDESEPPAELKGISEIPSRADSDRQVVVTPVAELAREATDSKTPASPEPLPQVVAKAAVTEDIAGAGTPRLGEPKPAARAEPAAAQPAKPKPPPAVARATPARSEQPARGWVVQVGVYSNPENAARMREKLKALDLAVREDRVAIEGGKAVRLRVGPYEDRNSAVKTQARLQKDAGVRGVVLAYP